jgi:hypothetical protein
MTGQLGFDFEPDVEHELDLEDALMKGGTGEPCLYCGRPWFLDVAECWTEDRAWMFDTCCEGAHDDACRDAEDDPRGFAKWFELRTGVKTRRCYNSDSELAMRLDFGLHAESVTLQEAKAFVGEHHRHNKPPVSWRWGHAVYNGHELVAVAMVGRPVARMIDGKTTVEVNRLCVNPKLDPELAWNACSMLYGASAKEAKRRGFERIITYTLETESAGTLKAAGWSSTHRTRGGSWNRPSRGRTDKAPTCRKIRWERGLTKGAKRAVTAAAADFAA